MKLASRLFFLLCIAIGLTWSCTKAVTIGSDFLDDEKSNLNFSDDFLLTFHTEKTDSILTHAGDITVFQLTTYLLGNLQDPIFGNSSTQLFVQPLLPTVGTDLIGSTLDSVVLQLRYDTLGLYGDLSSPVTLEVFQLKETPSFKTKYYSDEHFDFDENKLLGSVIFTPHPKDSIWVFQPGDSIFSAPHIRIPLSASIFTDIINGIGTDTSILTHQDTFQNYFHGLTIRMTGANNTMLGINLLNSLSGLIFYYDKPTEEDHIFKLTFAAGGLAGGVNTVHMVHDYAGSPVEAALGPDPEEEYWYVQGMSGVTTSMTVQGLDQLGNSVINEADLEFYATFPAGDNEAFYPPIPFIVTQEQTDTTLNYSEDVRAALGVSQGNHYAAAYSLLFDGEVGERQVGPPVVYRYNMKVTSQIRDILKGNKENIIYFNPYSKGDVPNRSVLFGPSHPIYAPRLRIYYTSL